MTDLSYPCSICQKIVLAKNKWEMDGKIFDTKECLEIYRKEALVERKKAEVLEEERRQRNLHLHQIRYFR